VWRRQECKTLLGIDLPPELLIEIEDLKEELENAHYAGGSADCGLAFLSL
jgi:hypothetical protein